MDRLRLHLRQPPIPDDAHPLSKIINSLTPHLLIRRLDVEEGRFVVISATIDGDISILSNSDEFARTYFQGIFLDCPPSFRTLDDFEIKEEWVNDETTRAMFAGSLAGAQGWDPSANIPSNISESFEEAKKSLDVANYKSSVAMSRRTLEAVLKFGFKRLLKRDPVDRNGRALTLDDLIKEFRNSSSQPIPAYLLNIADSIRLIGNVPGAHAVDMKDYHFSRSDAEFTLVAANHFLEQYFSKIDQEVSQYYALTIDLSTYDQSSSS